MRLLFAALAALALGGQPGPRVLDDFANPGGWEAAASDGVSSSARPFEGGLRLDYDFSRGSGYAFIRRELPLELPDNFELRFRLRGAGAANTLELKLVDASGDNVWWHRRADYVPPGEWQTIRVKRRQIAFAWGPTQDKTLRRAAAVEFVVAAGTGGGKGWIAVDDLEIVPLPVPPQTPPPVKASSPAGNAALAVDGRLDTAWIAPAGTPLELDLGYQREFGGLVLRWPRGAPAPVYTIGLSSDRRTWRELRREPSGSRVDWVRLEESEARYLRIVPADAAALGEVEVRPLSFGASLNDFVKAVAAETPRGAYPRGFVGEQNYWTLVASPEGGNSGLMDESGAIEVGRGGFSVEPAIADADRLFTWADVVPQQSLAAGGLPIPSVTWRRDGWSLTTTAYVEPGGARRLIGRYTVRNESAAPKELALVLSLRPFQVNPPQQFLNIRGGVSPVRSIRRDGDWLVVNGRPRLRLLKPPDAVRVRAFDTGPQALRQSAPEDLSVEDPAELAWAAAGYSLRLAPGQEATIAWAAPLDDAAPAGGPLQGPEAAERAWSNALGDVRITGPALAQPYLDTLRTALAHVLATRDGPALRPGSRSYARSWIRDGAMMSNALLRMGLPGPADRYLKWYAPYQYENGKVPCCVDARGADPVPEHDSHGQLIHLIAQLHRYATDMARLPDMWPRVKAAADHIEMLRQSTRTPTNRSGSNRPLFGLLPPSISHEGYSAKPAYSYWDNFWALTGLEDAAYIADRLGRTADAQQLRARIAGYRADILASIAATPAVHGNRFIPGAADLGDYDPTSTTIALAPGGLAHLLPQPMLEDTFERYWQESVARREGKREWKDYTPYEWRNVGALVRLGQRERAFAMAEFFMADRRPAAWNQWAEVIGRLPREPRFIGDMPHGWVASDYINALLDMLAYERAEDRALILAAGVPAAWLEGPGIGVQRLRTPYGPLTYRLRVKGGRGILDYRLEGTPPPGGLLLSAPGAEIRLIGARGRRAFSTADLPNMRGRR